MARSKPPARKLGDAEDFDGLEHATPSLPAAWYTDPEHYRAELEAVFYRNWLYVCHHSELAEPRSFRRFDVGTQSLLLLRADDGVLRAFHNTCRHRGSELCAAAAGRLERKLITCPYHQWSYALDGRLLATTSHAEAPDFDKADYGLLELPLEIWRGAVFVALGDDPPDFAAGLVRGNDRIDNWPLPELVVARRWRKTLACNWKVFWENFNECLHCPNIHPELVDLVPIYGRRISYYRDEPDWADHADDPDPRYRGGLRADAASWSDSGRLTGEPFAGLTPEELQRGQSYFVSLPSLFIAAHADYMRSVRVLPLGPEQTELEVEWLFTRETLARDDIDLDDVYAFGERVLLQDAAASEMNQRGLRARGFAHGVLMPEEYHVKAFHDWLRLQLGEPT